MNERQIIEKRANIWHQMQEIMERAEREGRIWSAEEREQYDRLEAELNELTEALEAARRHAEIERQLATPAGEPIAVQTQRELTQQPITATPQYRDAWLAWVRGGMADLTSEQRDILRRGYVEASREMRALGVGTDAGGGYTVPTGFWSRLAETLAYYANMRQVANVLVTSSGETLHWPTVDETAVEGAILAEGSAMDEGDPTFGQRTIGAHMYTSKIVRVSAQLLQDTGIDLEGFLARALGERIARIQNRHFTVGTGSGQPLGIATNPTIGRQAASGQVDSVTWDDLIDLVHSVDPAYRAGGRARFMLHDQTLAAVRKLKDGDGRPIWQPSGQAGVPDLLLGYPYTVNNYMPVMGANANSILFGDFVAGYVIRDVQGVALMRLTERYAEYLQVGFLAFARADGVPDDPAAVKAFRNAAS